jgi:hypothetical protein
MTADKADCVGSAEQPIAHSARQPSVPWMKVSVEMLRFHQLQSDDTTATFIQGTDGCRAEWAMGCSEDPTQSALSAVIACANRLYAEGR